MYSMSIQPRRQCPIIVSKVKRVKRESINLATYHFPENRSESQWNPIIQSQTPLNPIPTDTEKTLVPPVSAVDEVTKTALDQAAAE